ISDLEDKLEQLPLELHQSFYDSNIIGSNAVEEIFTFSSNCLEPEPDESKVKNEIKS
ncbi:19749_t:CDS:1, partial [Funneliformis geosporum]